jgi:ribonuclease VapC
VKAPASLDGAVVDSSAIMSIFEKRPSAMAFREGLKRSSKLYISAATLIELSVVFMGKKTPSGTQELDALLNLFNIDVVPFDTSMIIAARDGCAKYGRGHHKADLNFGDLFSYALAKKMNLPLYFEGMDFQQTDVRDAMLMLGCGFDEKHTPKFGVDSSLKT